MSNENETTGSEHNAEIQECKICKIEFICPKGKVDLCQDCYNKPIQIERDVSTFSWTGRLDKEIHSPGRFSYDTPDNHPKLEGNELKLTLAEANRVNEATLKFLNQTKNEGRHEVRTIKDKENQKIVDELKKLESKVISSDITPVDPNFIIYDYVRKIVKESTGKDIKDL